MKTSPFAVLGALFALSAVAVAQNNGQNNGRNNPARQPAAPLSPAGVAATLQNAERSQNPDALLLAYGEAVTNPTLARVAIGTLLSNYYSLRNQAQTADQATQAVAEATLRFMVLQTAQNQVIIQQNQQILEQNARLIQVMERNSRPATSRE